MMDWFSPRSLSFIPFRTKQIRAMMELVSNRHHVSFSLSLFLSFFLSFFQVHSMQNEPEPESMQEPANRLLKKKQKKQIRKTMEKERNQENFLREWTHERSPDQNISKQGPSSIPQESPTDLPNQSQTLPRPHKKNDNNRKRPWTIAKNLKPARKNLNQMKCISSSSNSNSSNSNSSSNSSSTSVNKTGNERIHWYNDK